MNVTRVDSNSNTNVLPLKDNNIIKILEKQKMQLQEQIQKTSESKIDDKTKQDRIKQLKDQILQIDMEIQQKQVEVLNKNQKAAQQASNNQTTIDDNEDSINLNGMSDLIQASSTYSKAKIMNNTKKSLNGKGRVLKIEIELDEKRGSEAKTKRAELQKIELTKRSLDKKIGETIQKTEKHVKETSEKVIKYKKLHTSNEEDILNNEKLKTHISNSDKNNMSEEVQKNHKKIDMIV